MTEQRRYTKPEVRSWGRVTEVTRTGLTMPNGDMKAGSRPSQGQ